MGGWEIEARASTAGGTSKGRGRYPMISERSWIPRPGGADKPKAPATRSVGAPTRRRAIGIAFWHEAEDVEALRGGDLAERDLCGVGGLDDRSAGALREHVQVYW